MVKNQSQHGGGNSNFRKPNYGGASTPVAAATATTESSSGEKGAPPPYELALKIGDELVKITGLFANTSKAGNDYFGIASLSSKDASTLLEAVNAAAEGAKIGVYVFKKKAKVA